MNNFTRSNPELYASLKELAQLGSPIDLSVAERDPSQPEPPTLEIEELGHQSRIFRVKPRCAGYMACVRITNQTSRAIYPLEMELYTPDGDPLDWLNPSRVPVLLQGKPGASCIVYKFPQGLTLSENEVLNHVLLDRQTLTPRRPHEGWLLATGSSMPAGVTHGQTQDLVLTITGSDHREYSKTISFWVDCAEPPAKAATPEPAITPADSRTAPGGSLAR